MNRSGSQEIKPRVIMLIVVPVEKSSRPVVSMLKGVKAAWIIWTIFQGLEMRLGKRIIIRPIKVIPRSMMYTMKIPQK